MAILDFKNDLERGKVGEKLFLNYLENNGVSVRDVSNDSAYWSKDIDLISANGITYEIKSDYRSQQTGNLAIEYLRESRDGE